MNNETINNETINNEQLTVNNEERNKRDFIYSFISLNEFKSLMGVDDRDDKLCRFCLVTSTLTIEEYCKRKFLRKQYFETIKYNNKYLLLPLKEYPVIEIMQISSEQLIMKNGGLIDPIFYRPYPGCAYGEELPFELLLSSSLKPYNLSTIKVSYIAGYTIINNEQLIMSNDLASNLSAEKQDEDCGHKHCSLLTSNCSLNTAHCSLPLDLSAACLELASWNFNRYKGKRIGMSGNIKGAGIQGEHYELTIPENVKALIEPYKRKVI